MNSPITPERHTPQAGPVVKLYPGAATRTATAVLLDALRQLDEGRYLNLVKRAFDGSVRDMDAEVMEDLDALAPAELHFTARPDPDGIMVLGFWPAEETTHA